MRGKLKRCGPLNDAVQIAGQFLKWNMLISLLMLPGLVGIGSLLGSGKVEREAVFIALIMMGVGFIFSLPMIGAIRLLLKEQSGAQDLCLLLRAFRSDERSDKFRAWLKGALGHQFKFSGIRPPRERISMLMTLVSPLLTGLRYLGSRQFEMEAPDHNWMARLLASFAQTRFVFIDLRDVTPHVLDEIRLAWMVFGRGRTVFVIDDRRSPAEWSAVVEEHLEDQTSGSQLQFLVWPTTDAPEAPSFTASVQEIVSHIPNGKPDVTQSSLAFVEQKVAGDNWDSRLMERPAPLILASIVVMSALTILIALIVPGADTVVGIGVNLVLQVFFWQAWNRARRQRGFAREINPAGSPSAARLWGSACSMLGYFVMLALLMTTLYSAANAVKAQAAKAKARIALMELKSAVRSYEADYGRKPWGNFDATGDEVVDPSEDDTFLRTLAGRNDAPGNPRRIVFLDIPVQELRARLVDEWGTGLKLAVDCDYDDIITVPSLPAPMPGNIIGLSAGRDKQWGTPDDLVVGKD